MLKALQAQKQIFWQMSTKKKRESQKTGMDEERASGCPEIQAAVLQIWSQFPPAEIDALVDGLS